jgi:FkbM family methyltransferase
MMKSILMHIPAAYEAVQSIRDRGFLRRAAAIGTFAQHREDLLLMEMLAKAGARGPYVDVGCNHPFKLSNTYLLYRNGWRGLCVDPLPRFSKLYRRWRPEDHFRAVAVGESSGELPLHEFESDVLSTLDADLSLQYQSQGYRLRGTSNVRVAPLNALLSECSLKAPVSLLSIDIEGHELPALKSIDLDKWRPVLVCIEALTATGKRNTEAIEYLVGREYEVSADLGLNVVLCRKSTAAL